MIHSSGASDVASGRNASGLRIRCSGLTVRRALGFRHFTLNGPRATRIVFAAALLRRSPSPVLRPLGGWRGPDSEGHGLARPGLGARGRTRCRDLRATGRAENPATDNGRPAARNHRSRSAEPDATIVAVARAALALSLVRRVVPGARFSSPTPDPARTVGESLAPSSKLF